MDDFSALTEAEKTILEALTVQGVRFMLVGLSAAVLQGGGHRNARHRSVVRGHLRSAHRRGGSRGWWLIDDLYLLNDGPD